MALRAPEVTKVRERQEPLWSTPPAAALGETLERLAIWSQRAHGRRFELRFAQPLVSRNSGKPRWWLDVRQRNKVVASFDGVTPAELAQLVDEWLRRALEVTP